MDLLDQTGLSFLMVGWIVVKLCTTAFAVAQTKAQATCHVQQI